MNLRTIRIENAIALGLTAALGGCAAAALGAAAGAAGAIAYTERGARSQVDASVAESAAATEAVFEEMGITITGRETEEGRAVEIRGESGEMNVNVSIERDDVTEIEVIAREGAIDYDKDYARSVLSRIVGRL